MLYTFYTWMAPVDSFSEVKIYKGETLYVLTYQLSMHLAAAKVFNAPALLMFSPGFNHNNSLEYYKDVASNISIQTKCHYSSQLSKYWIIINLIKQCQSVVYLSTWQPTAQSYYGPLEKIAKTATKYHLFSLDNTMRSKIITLGIRKQRNYESYRRSRGRRNIFHRISTVINQLENQSHLTKHCSKPS